jgi:hypothetical protein
MAQSAADRPAGKLAKHVWYPARIRLSASSSSIESSRMINPLAR